MSEHRSEDADRLERGEPAPGLAGLRAEVRFLRAVVLLCLIVLLVMFAALRVGGCSGPGRAIVVNGQIVCYVRGERAAERVRKQLIANAAGGLHSRAAIKETWEVVKPKVLSVDQAVKLLAGKVHVLIEGTAVQVEGKTLVIVPGKDEANQVLNLVMARYAPPDEKVLEKPQFLEKVKLADVVVPQDRVTSDPQKAVEKLVGASGDRYHTVVKGDNPSHIAHEYGMTLHQLYALNPGLHGRNLSVGEKIKVASTKPALTVVTVREITTRQPVPQPEQVTSSTTLPPGERKVIDPGDPGEKLITLKTTYHNDKRVKAQVLTERVIKQPTPKKVVVGEQVSGAGAGGGAGSAGSATGGR